MPGGSHEQRREELLECVHYFSRLWEERRENPGLDLLSMLVHGEATKDMTAMQHLGNLLLLWYLSANRDDDVFDNGDVIDIERPNADQQLAFGYGIHRCMGSRLAEMQVRILWEEILERFERVEVMAERRQRRGGIVGLDGNVDVEQVDDVDAEPARLSSAVRSTSS